MDEQVIVEEAGNQEMPAQETPQDGVQEAQVTQEPDWRAEAERWRKEHERLERKFNRESQRWKQHQDAVALWDYLTKNPELSQQVQALIDAYSPDAAQATLNQRLQQFESRLQQQLALKEAEISLRQDSVFREHEAEIRDWAEAEGFDLTDPRGLKNAFRAWKGENADRLLADAKLQAFKEAAKAPQQRRAAELRGAGTGGSREPNWKDMEDSDILAALGMSLFVEE